MHIHVVTQQRPAKADIYSEILTKIQQTAQTVTAVSDVVNSFIHKQ